MIEGPSIYHHQPCMPVLSGSGGSGILPMGMPQYFFICYSYNIINEQYTNEFDNNMQDVALAGCLIDD